MIDSILRIFTLKRTYIITLALIPLLALFNFYGPYTGEFYFVKVSNYFFPIVTLVHLAFLYVLWFKIKEGELPDPQMRILEFALYGVLLVYFFKLIKSMVVIFSYFEYESHLLPGAFLPLGLLLFVGHFLLVAITLLAIKYRRDRVGAYKFDDMNHIDSWE